MRNIDLSIIITSFNTKEYLNNCLASIYQSLQGTRILYEVIVVDNASTDGSLELINKKYFQTKLISNRVNVGFGQANNQAVTQAAGKVVLFLNSDIVIRDRAIEKLFHFFMSLPPKSVSGGKLYNVDGTAQSSCGPAYNLVNITIALFFKGDYLHLTRYSPTKVKVVDWVMGACMMTMKNAFDEVGEFDKGIFMYMEEIDWQYRAQKLGFSIYFYPNAHFVHVGAGSSHGRSTPILNVFRGLLFYYKKHHNWQKYLLRTILILKSIVAIGIFTFLNKKDDQKLYREALKLAISI